MQGITDQRRPLIFLAEDDDDDANFVRLAFKELDAGISIFHFPNGQELLRRLRSGTPEESPTLIILDLNMPVLDGRQTLKMIRNEICQLVPVIILSTSNADEEKKECLNSGANLYFTKPYSFHNYMEIVRGLKSAWLDSVSA